MISLTCLRNGHVLHLLDKIGLKQCLRCPKIEEQEYKGLWL